MRIHATTKRDLHFQNISSRGAQICCHDSPAWWRTHHFKTEKQARTFVDQQKVDLLNHGTAGNSIPLKLRVEALEAQKILEPYGVGILAAARHYVAHAQQITASVTVTHAKGELLKARVPDGVRARYLGDLRVRLGRFEKDFGSRSIATITGGRGSG